MSFSTKYDKPLFGVITALVLPIIGFFLSYLVKYYPKPFDAYWNIFLNARTEQTEIFTFSMIPSLLLFYFILFRWKMERASKTYVGVSLIFVTVFVYLNFFS